MDRHVSHAELIVADCASVREAGIVKGFVESYCSSCVNKLFRLGASAVYLVCSFPRTTPHSHVPVRTPTQVA